MPAISGFFFSHSPPHLGRWQSYASLILECNLFSLMNGNLLKRRVLPLSTFHVSPKLKMLTGTTACQALGRNVRCATLGVFGQDCQFSPTCTNLARSQLRNICRRSLSGRQGEEDRSSHGWLLAHSDVFIIWFSFMAVDIRIQQGLSWLLPVCHGDG